MTTARATLVVLRLLVGAVGLSLSSCDERFEYDVPRGGTGSGGAAAAAGAAASGGAAGAAAGQGGAGAFAGGGAAGSAERCGEGPACPSGLRCVGESCVECAVDADCAATVLQRCEPTLHRCVECLLPDDCPSDFGCDRVANHCLRTCSAELPCPADAHGCDEKRMVCYACDEDRECEDSPLGPYCAPDGSGCVACRGGEGCAAEQHCDELTGTCVTCRDGRDCDSGLCAPDLHTCLPRP